MSVSRTISEIFRVKESRDLETVGRGQSRSLKWRRSIDHVRLRAYYWSAIVRIALCYTIFELFDVE